MAEFKQNKEEKKVGPFTIKQFVWFVIGCLIAANALVFLVLGLIDDYAGINNSVLNAPNSSMKEMLGGIGFTWFGAITLMVAALIVALSLSFSSKDDDREKERTSRREQRLKAMREQQENQQKVVLDFSATSAQEENK
ncbi:MAG: hypothetical protein J6X03_01305 [Bacilli bacterium]|nr:hypothetical protein [Bacilli bacterium]